MALRERGLFGNRGSNQTLQTLFLIPIEGSHWQRQFVQFGAGISVSTIIVSHSCEFAFACYWCAKRRGTCKDFALNVGGRSVIAVLGCLAIIATSKAWAQAEDAEKEVTKQTTRQISNAVVGRVTAAETVGEGAINAWSTSSYNWISIRSSAPSGLGVTPGAVVPSAPNPNFGVGLFQQILGADTHIDRFVLGGSGAFSYTSANRAALRPTAQAPAPRN